MQFLSGFVLLYCKHRFPKRLSQFIPSFVCSKQKHEAETEEKIKFFPDVKCKFCSKAKTKRALLTKV